MTDLSPLILETINSGCDVKLKVTGNSMYPLLRNRIDDILLTKPDKLRRLDVPLYIRENGQYVLHRIVKKGEEGFYLAGDNETKPEYPVNEKQVIAVLKGIYRKGRFIPCSLFLYRLYSFTWVLILPFRHIVLRFLTRIRRK